MDVTYEFDALGRRVYRDDGTSAVVYVQSGQQTIADYAAGTSAASPTYRYVWASYIDEPVLRVDSSGTKLYYHRNQQYSVVALTNASGGIVERYAYTAYGEPTILSGSGSPQSFATYKNRYTYTGREWDEKLELYHYRARMYSASEGRFISRDPIGYEGSPWNLFEHAGSSPVTLLDPSGNFAIALPVVIPAGVGIVALKAAAAAAGVGLFACLMRRACLGDARNRTLDKLDDMIDDLFNPPRAEPRIPPPHPRTDYPPLDIGLDTPPIGDGGSDTGDKDKDKDDDDPCNCCEFKMECGGQFNVVQNCRPMSKAECESDDDRSCMPPGVKNGDRNPPIHGPDGNPWPYNPHNPLGGSW